MEKKYQVKGITYLGLDLTLLIHYFIGIVSRFVRCVLTDTSVRVHLLSHLVERLLMNKSQLIEALAKAENLALKKAEEIVNTVFGDMETALIDGQRVEIRGFGSFKIKHYQGYKGRNPKTGEVINVAEKKLPFFKVGKELKERVDM